MSHLLPCPSCTRHIRATEEACPFCAAPTSSAFRATRPAPLPLVRLGRAALLAWGTTLTAAACDSAETTAPPPVAPTPVAPTPSAPPAVLSPVAEPTPPAPEPPPAIEPPPEVVVEADDTADEPPSPMRRRRPPPDQPPDLTVPAYGAPVSAYGAPSF